MDNIQLYYQKGIDFIWNVVPDLLLAIAVLLIGLWVIKLVAKGLSKVERRNFSA